MASELPTVPNIDGDNRWQEMEALRGPRGNADREKLRSAAQWASPETALRAQKSANARDKKNSTAQNRLNIRC